MDINNYMTKNVQLLTNLHKEMSEKNLWCCKMKLNLNQKNFKSYKIKKRKNIDIGCNKISIEDWDIFCYKQLIDCSFNKLIQSQKKGVLSKKCRKSKIDKDLVNEYPGIKHIGKDILWPLNKNLYECAFIDKNKSIVVKII